MTNRSTIKNYIKYFKKGLSNRVHSGIAINCVVHLVEGEGAVLEFILNSEDNSRINFRDSVQHLNQAVSKVEQNLVGGNLEGVKFSGTNISMQDNRIVLIKGEDFDEKWSKNAAKNDVNKIFHGMYGENL